MKQPHILAAGAFFTILLVGCLLLIAPQFLAQNNVEAPDDRDYIEDELEPLAPIDDVDFQSPEDVPVIEDGAVIASFEDCVEAGHAVMESYPPMCRANGVLFTQEMQDPAVPPVTPGDVAMCTADVKICDDGSYVSRTAPHCAFAACPGEVPTEEDTGTASNAHVCTATERQAQICTMEYAPVCGTDGNMTKTYSNGCTACGSGSVDSYTQGECSP